MQIKEIMTKNVDMITPGTTVVEAARMMRDDNVGALTVYENDRLVGMVTDRDIVVRCLANGHGSDSRVGDALTGQVRYCFEDQDSDDVLANMSEQKVRRLPVLNRDKRLVGVVSFGDLVPACSADKVQAAFQAIVKAP